MLLDRFALCAKVRSAKCLAVFAGEYANMPEGCRPVWKSRRISLAYLSSDLLQRATLAHESQYQ